MGRITPQVVQNVRDAIDIVDIASQLATLKRQGKKYVALCPFHKEKTPSFQIDPDLGLYHCFGCGAGGDAIKLHMETSGDDFPAAIEALAQRYGIPLPADDGERPGRPALDLTGALEAAHTFFTRQLASTDMPRAYLDERKIDPELRQTFGLGYAPESWHDLLEALRPHIEMKLLVAAGLVGISERTDRPYDRFRHRLMFPIHSTSGRLVGFGGRTLGDDRAKYVNTAETEAFKKGYLLYGLHQAKRAIRDSGRAILVEGYFDVLAMAASGLPEAVAGMGTSLTAEQAKLLSRFADRVVLAYDGDEAGNKAAAKALPLLLAAGMAVDKAPFPAGHDPDSLRLEAGPDEVKRLVEEARDAVQLTLDRLTGFERAEHDQTSPQQTSQARQDFAPLDPNQLASAAEEVRGLLQAIRNPIARAAYARSSAQRLGVDEELLLRARASELYSRGLGTGERKGKGEHYSGERRALQWLLLTQHPLPELSDMPPADAFLVQTHRRIAETFLDLYHHDGAPPEPRELLDVMAEDQEAVADLADLLLEELPGDEEPQKADLALLETRWIKRKSRQLQAEIQAASKAGDLDTVQQLLAKRKELIRRRHPSMSGRFW